MANDQECAVIVRKRLFQHVLGEHVQVIGRLIEQQQVEWPKEHTCQCQPCALATTEGRHFFVDVFTAKKKGAQNAADFGAHLFGAVLLQGLEECNLWI